MLVIFVWLGLAAGAAALGAEYAGGARVARVAGIAATLGSVMTAWAVDALSARPSYPGSGITPARRR
jgi:hypothetical protein